MSEKTHLSILPLSPQLLLCQGRSLEATAIQRGPSQAMGSLGLIPCQPPLGLHALSRPSWSALIFRRAKRQLRSKDLETRALWHVGKGRVSETGAENGLIASNEGRGRMEATGWKATLWWWPGTTWKRGRSCPSKKARADLVVSIAGRIVQGSVIVQTLGIDLGSCSK